jgi:hypothetical protein
MPNRNRSKEWHALRAGKQVELDGFILKGLPEEEIQAGDYYVAERNSGPQFLQARVVDMVHGCIHPNSPGYSFDLWECVKVRLIDC